MRDRAVVLVVCADVQSTGGCMKRKVVVSLFGFLFLFAAASRAQEGSRISVFGGYSYVRANPSDNSGLGSFSMNGGDFSAAYNVNGWLSGVADIGGYHATRPLNCAALGCSGTGDFKGNTWTYLFGPRVTFRHFGRSHHAECLPHQQSNGFRDECRRRLRLPFVASSVDPTGSIGILADALQGIRCSRQADPE
jgi:hypothetical protein